MKRDAWMEIGRSSSIEMGFLFLLLLLDRSKQELMKRSNIHSMLHAGMETQILQ